MCFLSCMYFSYLQTAVFTKNKLWPIEVKQQVSAPLIGQYSMFVYRTVTAFGRTGPV